MLAKRILIFLLFFLLASLYDTHGTRKAALFDVSVILPQRYLGQKF